MRNWLYFLLLAAALSPLSAGERGICSRGGALTILDLETGEESPVTSGHSDMKPSWSKNGDRIVFFRVTKFAPKVGDWHTAICVINSDGTGFRQLTEGRHADYNPTWTRDGTEAVLYSRYDPTRNRSVIHRITFTGPERQEFRDEIISDPKKSEYMHTTLKDGRILITSDRKIFKGIYWLLTPGDGPGKGSYEPLAFDFRLLGFMDRVTFSPDETRITFEYKPGFNSFEYVGKTIYIASFDMETLTISTPLPISEPHSFAMTLYPRWTSQGDSVIWHSNREGKHRLYRWRIEGGKTEVLPGDPSVDYEFFCGERSPK